MSEPSDARPISDYPQSPYPSNPYPQQGAYPQQGPYPSGSYPQQQGPYPPGLYPPQYPPMMVAPKSPAIAVLASFFIPGLGSMISGRGGLGTLILCLYLVSWLLTIFLIGIVGVIGCWIWGMIQGYSDAVAWNRSHGIIS